MLKLPVNEKKGGGQLPCDEGWKGQRSPPGRARERERDDAAMPSDEGWEAGWGCASREMGFFHIGAPQRGGGTSAQASFSNQMPSQSTSSLA